MSKLSWLARRLPGADGVMNLLVVDLSIGNNHLETEEKLNSLGFQLGDFVNVSQDKEYTKPNTNNLNTREDNDFGYVDKLMCKLHKIDGVPIFTSKLFGSSLCTDDSLEEGPYSVTIRWLEKTEVLSDGTVLYSVATEAAPKPQKSQKSTLPTQKSTNQSHQQPEPQVPIPAPRRFFPAPPSLSSTCLPDIDSDQDDGEGSEAESDGSTEPSGIRKETFKFLWAARRSFDKGTAFLDCVDLKTGELFSFEELKLNQQRIELKMFFRFYLNSRHFVSRRHTSNVFTISEHDLAYILNVDATLTINGDQQLFVNNLTAPAICREDREPGRYIVRISLLETPRVLADGTEIVFEATEPKLRELLHYYPPFRKYCAKYPKKIHSSRFSTRNNNPIDTDVVPPQISDISDPIETLKAIVLDRNGNSHRVWLPEKKVESTFFFREQLKRRDFFEGRFERMENGNREFREYRKRIDPFITTGLDASDNIWLQVVITNYDRQSDRRFPHAEAEHVGRIVRGIVLMKEINWFQVDIDYKLSFDCKGKQVRVQRQKVWDDHFEWVVTEVL